MAFVGKDLHAALNSAREANLVGLSRADEEALTCLINDYFVDDDGDEDMTDSETDISDDGHVKAREGDDSLSTGAPEDDDGEDEDRPTVDVGGGPLEDELEEVMAEDVDVELRRVRDFDCGCRCFDGESCIRQFAPEDVVDLRLNMAELTEGEKDLILMGICHTSMDTSKTVRPKGKNRKEERERTRPRTMYSVNCKRVCAATFRFLHMVSKNKLSAVHKWYRDNGLTVRRKKSGGRNKCAQPLTYEDTTRIFQFINNFTEDHALVLPGRVSGFKGDRLRLLPSMYTKTGIWREFYKPAMETTGHRVAGLSTFTEYWRKLCPHIVCCKPMTDLCWVCQKNNNLIIRTINCDEGDKSETLRKQEDHLQHVRVERELYKTQVAHAKEVAAVGNLKLGQNPPCSRTIAMHYSFDFAQQVHFPSNPLQPGPMYFLTPRKCGIFGVCCEAIPTQVNYLIDEGMSSSKGSNAVISYLHHYFGTYGLGEDVVHLHCDNCSGQNKNRYMLFYMMWRSIYGLHKSITLNFMVAGHTKFSPDWCFGLLKQKYRRSPVSSLQDLVRVTNTSTATGVNKAQLVGSEAQEVYVPTYNWQAFLGEYFKPLNGIKSFQHFRFSSDEPGVVYASKRPSDDEQRYRLLRTSDAYPPERIPEQMPPPGLDAARQWYLYEKIREFCIDDAADTACPQPTVPKPHSNIAD